MNPLFVAGLVLMGLGLISSHNKEDQELENKLKEVTDKSKENAGSTAGNENPNPVKSESETGNE